MPKAAVFDSRPWWDDGPNPIYREDGTRYSHRIDYERLPMHPEFWEGYDLPGLWSADPKTRLNARKKLWRRLRTGFYQRNDPKPSQREKREKQPVPRCGATCRDGHRCRALAVVNPVTGKQRRCRMHGGKSPGPKTAEGKARSLAALARGRSNRGSLPETTTKKTGLGTVPA